MSSGARVLDYHGARHLLNNSSRGAGSRQGAHWPEHVHGLQTQCASQGVAVETIGALRTHKASTPLTTALLDLPAPGRKASTLRSCVGVYGKSRPSHQLHALSGSFSSGLHPSLQVSVKEALTRD